MRQGCVLQLVFGMSVVKERVYQVTGLGSERDGTKRMIHKASQRRALGSGEYGGDKIHGLARSGQALMIYGSSGRSSLKTSKSSSAFWAFFCKYCRLRSAYKGAKYMPLWGPGFITICRPQAAGLHPSASKAFASRILEPVRSL